MPIPVARFSPAPGLFVDRTERSIEVTGQMELFGPEATGAHAQRIQDSINQTWTASFPDGFSIRCNVTVTLRAPGVGAGAATQIEAVRISGPSEWNRLTRSMTLNANQSLAFTWIVAHEFGHVIGLDDRYSETIMSQLLGRIGYPRTTIPDPGYETNLMAVPYGVLQARNLGDLAAENEPSPYWINDDNQVRDWVNHHKAAEVGLLSTANKLKMIQTLMGGWISDEDVAVIIRICSNVTTREQAAALRQGINLTDFTSIGQRTRVRVAFAAMP